MTNSILIITKQKQHIVMVSLTLRVSTGWGNQSKVMGVKTHLLGFEPCHTTFKLIPSRLE